ncbi:hypothetical protein NQ317_009270, partial [Molorchus minor]
MTKKICPRYREHKFKEDVVTSSISSTNEFFNASAVYVFRKHFEAFVIGLGSLATIATNIFFAKRAVLRGKIEQKFKKGYVMNSFEDSSDEVWHLQMETP